MVASLPDEYVRKLTKKDRQLLYYATQLVDISHQFSIELRALGSAALLIHVLDKNPDLLLLMKTLGRAEESEDSLLTDVDLIGSSRQKNEINKIFTNLGLEPIIDTFFLPRLIYTTKEGYHIDVFFDKLEFAHDVPFLSDGKNRLSLCYPTISITDYLLEKLQIHDVNRKDLIDVLTAFAGHEVGDHYAKGMIDGDYIATLLSDDWGFWYDATNNLNRVKSLAKELDERGKLPHAYAVMVITRIDKLLEIINGHEKSNRWKKRAEIGTRKPWYRVVEEGII